MKRIAFLFPGQGSQYVGMSKALCESFAEARDTFEEANNALAFDIKKLCMEGSMEELTKTENTQPAILTASVAAFRVYMKEIGIAPVFTAGHSLGEYSALCCAGAIKFSDAVKIVRQRGKFMQEAVPVGVGGMAAISGVSQQTIEEECVKASKDGKLVVVSNYNSPEQIVISGNIEAVNEAGEKLKALGARVIPLKVSAPFHSPLMQPAADRLGEELTKYTFADLQFSVLSNITGEPYPGKECLIDYLTKQLVQAVRWQSCMGYVQKQGVDLAVELGPQAVLKNLMRKNAPGIKTYSFESDSDIQTLKKQCSEENQGITNGMDVIVKCIATAVCTKNSNWDDQEYQKGVVEPYRKVKALKDEIVKENRQPTLDEVLEALNMLKSVLTTKKVSAEEMKQLFDEIFESTQTKGLFSTFQY